MVYENWAAFQRTEVVANTIKKYNADYKRLFEGTPGHTVAVNESNYTYDITEIAKKRDFVLVFG